MVRELLALRTCGENNVEKTPIPMFLLKGPLLFLTIISSESYFPLACHIFIAILAKRDIFFDLKPASLITELTLQQEDMVGITPQEIHNVI